MKKKIVLTEIMDKARSASAINFAKYLDDNKINWTMQECNIMDYDDGFFNITLDNYKDEEILFIDGEFTN